MDLRGKRFLVVGGAGFIGSHVVDELLKEDVGEILVYDNFCRGRRENLAQALSDPRAKICDVGGDITQPDILASAMKGVHGVFHLAALWLLQCHDYPRTAFDVNIRGTFNVLEACRDSGAERLVFSSSASVYGDALEIPMTEDHPFNNRTFYGATKIAGEQMARASYARYALDYTGLRYMNVYGPRQDYRGAYVAVIMKILDRLDQGLEPVVYGDGSQAYDFVFVSDCARANVLAMKATITDRFYNVGAGTKTTIRQLTERILAIRGVDVGIRYEPAGQTFVTHRVGCTRRARSDLGFEATVGLDEGLARLIAWRKADQEVAAR